MATIPTIGWLAWLYGGEPAGYLNIVNGPSNWAGRNFSDIKSASAYAAEADAGAQPGNAVYCRLTTLASLPDEHERGAASGSRSLPGFAMDLDLSDGEHKPQKLPRYDTEEELRQLLRDAGLPEPSAWVHSGGGRYPFWRFATALDVTDPETRALAATTSNNFQRAVIELAESRGRKIDNTSDLARVYRLPGTHNRKRSPHVLAHVIEISDRAYDLADFAGIVPAAGTRGVDASSSVTGNGTAELLAPAGPRSFDAATAAEKRAKMLARFRDMDDSDAGFNSELNNVAMYIGHYLPDFLSYDDAYAQLWEACETNGMVLHAKMNSIIGQPNATIRSGLTAGMREPYELTGVDVVGGELPAPSAPYDVAVALAARLNGTWAYFQGEWYGYTGTHWARHTDASETEKWLYRQLSAATYAKTDPKGETRQAPWCPNRTKVGDVLAALRALLRRDAAKGTDRVVVCLNGVLDLATGRLDPHTPKLFNLHCLPFAFDAAAGCPEWLRFLASLKLGADDIGFVQEWFGYVVSGRTDLQKMASLVGPTRSGKSTVTGVLERLLGPGAVTSPPMRSLRTDFGAASTIGKSLILLPEARWHFRGVGDVVEFLKAVTGGDSYRIARKHRDDWDGKLDARVMATSNEMPHFNDDSGAMAARMIHVIFTESFEGREDAELASRLSQELSGILNWALAGLARLNTRGKFAESLRSREAGEQVRSDTSPALEFVDTCAAIEEGAVTTLDMLYAAYRAWGGDQARNATRIGTSRAVISASRGKVTSRQIRESGRKVRVLVGIRLIDEYEQIAKQQLAFVIANGLRPDGWR